MIFARRERSTTVALFAMLSDKTSSWPTTAAVTPGALQAAFDAVTVAAVRWSASSCRAAPASPWKMRRTLQRRTWHTTASRVVDSLAISGALALTLHTAGRLAQSGATAAHNAEVARHMGEAIESFTVDTLDYLHRGGRIKGSQALLGSLLSIKPVLWLNKGHIELRSRARGKKKALAIMLDECVKAMPAGEPVHALIFDAAAAEEAEDGRCAACPTACRAGLPHPDRPRGRRPRRARVSGMAVCPASVTR